ncbi:MAG TPA: hypothetical protein EYQ42_08760 [Thiotrichaceae bacterium]|jgi:hypothetical protein|nr:hypothetical protein [Thiotrichaceae bacterium]HIM08183.1 hypothetical protein [Gammaproteobacteria bacterium]
MKNWQAVAYKVLRCFFIFLMLSTAIGKLLDIPDFAEVIATYQFGIPGYFATGLGLVLALFEFELAFYMLRKPRSLIVGPTLTIIHSSQYVTGNYYNLSWYRTG